MAVLATRPPPRRTVPSPQSVPSPLPPPSTNFYLWRPRSSRGATSHPSYHLLPPYTPSAVSETKTSNLSTAVPHLKKQAMTRGTLLAFLALALLVPAASFGVFSPPLTRLVRPLSVHRERPATTRLAAVEEDGASGTEVEDKGVPEAKKKTLEEKMASWEATEEEQQSATLGGFLSGMTPGKSKTDGFDVGLYIAFPIMVVTGLVFALFPLLVPYFVKNFDIMSVGPPPIV